MHPLATLVYFHLKYCERCGGLWLRPDGGATPYCPRCEHITGALPARHRRPRVPVTSAASELLSTAADIAQPGSAGVA